MQRRSLTHFEKAKTDLRARNHVSVLGSIHRERFIHGLCQRLLA